MKPQENEQILISPYLCQHCDKTYTSVWDLKNHIKVVHGPDKVKCPNCKQCFTRQYNLREHLKKRVCNPTVAAYNREWYKCSQCEKCFSQKKYLKIHHCEFVCKHMLKIGVNKFNIETAAICGFKYKDHEEKKVHMSKVHTIERNSSTYVYAENVKEDKN